MKTKAKAATDLESFSTTLSLLRQLVHNIFHYRSSRIPLAKSIKPAFETLCAKKDEVRARLTTWEQSMAKLPKPWNQLTSYLSFLK